MTRTNTGAIGAMVAVLIALCGCSASTPSTTTSATSAQSSSTTAESPETAGTTINPYAKLPTVPRLSVTSTSVQDGQPFSTPQMSGLFGVPHGQDQSPELTWSPGPPQTKSYVITMYDADAPTGSGFWHWVVYGIPVTTHSLSADAGAANSVTLPQGSIQANNDAGMARYLGAAPPKGDQPHHYFLTVTAIDTDQLPITANASPALIGFTISTHTLARGDIVATAKG